MPARGGHGAAGGSGGWSPPPYDLTRQPQRPGELCHQLMLGADSEGAARSEQLAAATGLALPMWVTLAVEAQRALGRAQADLGLEPGGLSRLLDGAAAEPASAGGTGKLAGYAAALRELGPRPPLPVVGALAATPSELMLNGWELSAAKARLSVAEWAADRLAAPAPARLVSWEAAAAGSGCGMAEWVLLQAARASRAASTAAQLMA